MRTKYDLTDRAQLETGIVIELPLAKNPGSDQEVEYLGNLSYPFAPPASTETNLIKINTLVTYEGLPAMVTILDGKWAVIDYLGIDGAVVGTEKVLLADIDV